MTSNDNVPIESDNEVKEMEEGLLNKEANTVKHVFYDPFCKCKECQEENEGILGECIFAYCFIPCLATTAFFIYIFETIRDVVTFRTCTRPKNNA